MILWPDDSLGRDIYRQIVARRYHRQDGVAITAVIALGAAQNYALQLHRPEMCYPASGFTIERNSALPLRVEGRELPARLMLARRGSRRDTVLYWTRIGEDFPQDLWDQRLTIARRALLRDPADGAVARFSITDGTGEARAILADFVGSLHARLPVPDRASLFGPAFTAGETV